MRYCNINPARLIIINSFFVLAIPFTSQGQLSQKEKQKIISEIESRAEEYGKLSRSIWEFAELGFIEKKSTNLLQSRLQEEGFDVKVGVAGMPTSFVAEYGNGGPVIALLAEYDALPGMSQKAIPTIEPRVEQGNGHGCGHHLFGVGSLAAAIHVKNWLEETNSAGTIRLYGTPAEEGGGGKVYMVRAGLFDDVDGVLSWHPWDSNHSNAQSSLAAISVRFRFYGTSAHASAAPWRGRSALDGIEAMNHMVNLMREHVTQETRIHYAITNGALAANVVPAYAEASYIIRHPDMRECKDVFDRVIKIAKAAADGTETRMEYEIETGYYNKLPNEVMSMVMYKNLQMVGGVSYDDDERSFALEIQKTYASDGLTPETAKEIGEFKVIEKGSGGSTDVGDISWVRPTAGLRTATWVPGTVPHSWQAVAAGGMTIGQKGMMVAAKTLALTALDLIDQPNQLQNAEEELKRRRGEDFEYEALLGDREPPLDYRVDQK